MVPVFTVFTVVYLYKINIYIYQVNIFTDKCRPDLNVYCVVAVAVVSGGNHYILDRKRYEDGTSGNRDEYLNCDDENDLKISVKDSSSKEKGVRTVRKSCQEKILLKILK